MAKLIIAFTLCLCMAVTLAADLKQLMAERAAATGPGPRVLLQGVNAATGGIADNAGPGVKSVASKSNNDQETASSFYGVGFYGPGYSGFYGGGPFFGGYPYGGFGYGGYGGFGVYGWPGAFW